MTVSEKEGSHYHLSTRIQKAKEFIKINLQDWWNSLWYSPPHPGGRLRYGHTGDGEWAKFSLKNDEKKKKKKD